MQTLRNARRVHYVAMNDVDGKVLVLRLQDMTSAGEASACLQDPGVTSFITIAASRTIPSMETHARGSFEHIYTA